MKTMKFRQELIDLMRKGEKTISWRVFDDKNLSEGDTVSIINWDSTMIVGTARIASVSTGTLKALWDHHTPGHEAYTTKDEMLATFQHYYGDRVTFDTEVKVITFTDIRLGALANELVFYDAEFSSLNPYIGELVSVGFVKEDGTELYLELEYDGEWSEWTQKNLVHTLTAPKIGRQEARDRIREFVGETRPHLCAYNVHFDATYLAKLFAEDQREGETTLGPFSWVPLDLASLLYTHDIDPLRFSGDTALLETLGVDTKAFVHTHNALDDARLVRETCLKLKEQQH